MKRVLRKYCFYCKNKLSRPVTIRADKNVSCGICSDPIPNYIENGFPMEEISNYNLEAWK